MSADPSTSTAAAETRRVKYVFLDVVGFTQDRSVEAQTDIVSTLNSVVRGALTRLTVKIEEVVFLPTGDGVCIALLGQSVPFDIHIQVALAVLELVELHNRRTTDAMRRFTVRIGINENVDNIVVDINGRQNVAGAGINTAQRVMAVADGNQILIAPVVFDTLRHREAYMKCFHSYQATIKHGVVLPVIQFIEEGHPGLSTSMPSVFAAPTKPVQHKLTELEALFMAHALKQRTFLDKYRGQPQAAYAANVWLWFRAIDSATERANRTYSVPTFRVYGKRKLTADQELEYYVELDFWVCVQLSDYVKQQLREIVPFVERVDSSESQFHIVGERGKAKLRSDRPDIWDAFDLGGV